MLELVHWRLGVSRFEDQQATGGAGFFSVLSALDSSVGAYRVGMVPGILVPPPRKSFRERVCVVFGFFGFFPEAVLDGVVETSEV